MKLAACLLVFCSILFGCKKNELQSEQISTISVVRETSSNSNTSQTKASNIVTPTPTFQHLKVKYHIIVASYSLKEKSKAQDLVAKLKAKDYPASVLNSSQRYRVSIESFASEAEAKAKIARDEYREAVNPKGIWVHKVEN